MKFEVVDGYELIGGEFRCPFCKKKLKVDEKREVWGHGEVGTVYSVCCDCMDIVHTESMYAGYKDEAMRELTMRGYIKKVNRILFKLGKIQ